MTKMIMMIDFKLELTELFIILHLLTVMMMKSEIMPTMNKKVVTSEIKDYSVIWKLKIYKTLMKETGLMLLLVVY
jgi:hypothetical protein